MHVSLHQDHVVAAVLGRRRRGYTYTLFGPAINTISNMMDMQKQQAEVVDLCSGKIP